jgi:hypothetical protein
VLRRRWAFPEGVYGQVVLLTDYPSHWFAGKIITPSVFTNQVRTHIESTDGHLGRGSQGKDKGLQRIESVDKMKPENATESPVPGSILGFEPCLPSTCVDQEIDICVQIVSDEV